MKIGIIGVGVVGGAIKFGFEKIGHCVKYHDIKFKNTKVSDLVGCEIIFVCTPTPEAEDGSCDTTIVESVVFEVDAALKEDVSFAPNNYPIIAIKSTVQPGTTQKLIAKYPHLKFCFVPEFLRERCAVTDFTENHDLCVVGTEDHKVFEIVKRAHGNLPDKVIQLGTTEAELVKYFNNAYNATLITFANSFYEVCVELGVNYTEVKNAVVNRKHIAHNYLECNDNFRGFGGPCLPKDLRALSKIAKRAGVDFFKNILDENDKYKTTVYEGMRDE